MRVLARAIRDGLRSSTGCKLTLSNRSDKDDVEAFYPAARRHQRASCIKDGMNPAVAHRGLARYAKHNANFVLVVSGGFKAKRIKELIEIVYDLLIKAIEMGSFALLKFGVGPVGLK